jgi:hypothetical protein
MSQLASTSKTSIQHAHPIPVQMFQQQQQQPLIQVQGASVNATNLYYRDDLGNIAARGDHQHQHQHQHQVWKGTNTVSLPNTASTSSSVQQTGVSSKDFEFALRNPGNVVAGSGMSAANPMMAQQIVNGGVISAANAAGASSTGGGVQSSSHSAPANVFETDPFRNL